MTVTLQQVRALVALRLGRSEVAAGDRLLEDLAAESGDLVVLLADLEELYGVTFEETAIASLHTVADLHHLVVTQQRFGEPEQPDT